MAATQGKRKSRNRPSTEPIHDERRAFSLAVRRVVDAPLPGIAPGRKRGPAAKAIRRKRGKAATTPMPTAVVKRALALGKAQAEFVLARRTEKLAVRKQAIARAQRDERRRKSAKRPVQRRIAKASSGMASAGAALSATRGVLVAEGDSWFDYPFADVLSELEDCHGWDVQHVAHRGDPVESMAYDGGQLTDLVRTIERVVRNGQQPHAILISGGGNDVAGPQFATFLHHRDAPLNGLDEAMVAAIVDQRVRSAYITIVAAVTSACESMLGARIPILLHGYDYPVPDGRGFWGGFGPLPGPWLAPGFEAKGYEDLRERMAIAAALIDRFNAMLEGLVALPGFEHLRLVPLRGTLSTVLANDAYRDWWDNEMHPTGDGFRAVAQRFDDLL
jgi:lysophospholipase L1-like esterase